MGLFDFFKRKPATPDDLREVLIQAAGQQDWTTFASLCERHQDEIRTQFPEWRTVPEAIRNDASARDRYCQGLIAMAQLFEQAGDHSLMALLVGEQASNPLAAWERDLTTAQTLIDDAQPGEAVALLESVLTRNAGLSGAGVDHYLPRTYGMLGVACFRAGAKTRAVECTEKARELCAAQGDQEGVATYTANLQHIREGATVVFRAADGRTLTLEELRGASGPVRYEIIGSVNIPAHARELHQQGRQAGERGDYQQALALLAQAADLAPQWPYPVYDMAYTYLLLQNFAEALQGYRKTVALAPRGFFTALTALAALEAEQNGQLPSGTYLAYLALEWLPDRAKKLEVVRQMVVRVPHFAPAWKELATLVEDDGEAMAAIDKGLAANPDPDTRGILQINQALVLSRQGQRAEAIQKLGELATNPSSTFATEHMAKSTLALITTAGS